MFVDFGKWNMEKQDVIDELNSLAETAGVEVVGNIYQKRDVPDSKYYIGEGKIAELKALIDETGANLVIFENELAGSKISNISNAVNTKVIDRSMLILDIFAGRATTNEGKLQVELAQLKYSLPRLSSLSESSGKYGGGVGMRGPGETKLELSRRIIEKNIQKKQEELKKLKDRRDLNRKSRMKGNNSKPLADWLVVAVVTTCFVIDLGVVVFPIPFWLALFTAHASNSNSIPAVAVQLTFAEIPAEAVVAA